MVNKFLKKQSKRVPARRRYKIEKKVRQHNKKLKREAKKNPKKKLKKDPGVPNSLPFKEEILREAEERKRKLAEMKKLQKEERQNLAMGKISVNAEEEELQSELKKSERKEKDNDKEKIQNQTKQNTNVEYGKVIEAADVILEVLDARDPLGSRCLQIEEAIINSGTKKLLLVLNKIDLVPNENVSNWLKSLRNELPTVPFKSIQNEKMNLIKNAVISSKSNNCLGADLLMKLLGNYCQNNNIKTPIKIGVVGFANVGKSSVVNSLKQTQMQENVDKNIVLLDSTGIIFAKSALRNAVKGETLEDPIVHVEEIVKKCNRQELMLFYAIPEFSSVTEFVTLIAKKQGNLNKRREFKIKEAARTIINNWNKGKIKYYTPPPTVSSLPPYLNEKLISEMNVAFDIEKLLEEEQGVLSALPKVLATNFITHESIGPIEGVAEPQTPSEPMEEDKDIEPKNEVDKQPQAKKKKLNRPSAADKSLKLNKLSKSQFKRLKKKRKKIEQLAESFSETIKSVVDSCSNGKNLNN